MKLVYLFTELGLSGGPIVHYNVMNGLLERGHQIFVVTKDDYFVWSKDAYRQHLPQKEKTGERDFLNVIGKWKRRVLRRLLPNYANHLIIGREVRWPDVFQVKNTIAQLTFKIIENYKALGVSPDAIMATHPYTADAAYKLQGDAALFMYSLHFEELMFNHEYDRAEIRALYFLPFKHIVNSTWLKRMFSHLYGIDAKLVTPAIDTTIFEVKNTLEKHDDSGQVILLSYCDPSRQFKGYPQQVEILRKVKRENPSLQIRLYGNKPQELDFDISYLGWLTPHRLAEEYRKAHILFSSSWYESFPYPPLEAMLSHCAVVACRYGTEDYLEDGCTGMVIDPFDVDATVFGLSDLINNPQKRKDLASKGQIKALDFRWNDKVLELEGYITQNLPKEKRELLDVDRIRHCDLSQLGYSD